MKSVIRQSGFERDEFYAATKGTAKKVAVSFALPKDLTAEAD